MKSTCSTGCVSSAMRAKLLEGHSAWEGTDLTVLPPASATVTAALWLGDSVPVARSDLAHALQDFSEAVALPVVWKTNCASQRILMVNPRGSRDVGNLVRNVRERAYFTLRLRNWEWKTTSSKNERTTSKGNKDKKFSKRWKARSYNMLNKMYVSVWT